MVLSSLRSAGTEQALLLAHIITGKIHSDLESRRPDWGRKRAEMLKGLRNRQRNVNPIL